MFLALLSIILATCGPVTVNGLAAVKMVTYENQIVLGASDNQKKAIRSPLECMVFSSRYSWKSFFYRPSDGFCQRNAEVLYAASNWEPGNGTKFYLFVRGCPTLEGYILDETSKFCYKIHEDSKTWSNARKICREEGGDLVALDIPKNYDLLVRKLRDIPRFVGFDFFVGAREIAHNDWRWINGKHLLLNDSKWALGEPNNMNGRQDYLIIAGRSNHKFDDFDIDEERYFICEITVL